MAYELLDEEERRTLVDGNQGVKIAERHLVDGFVKTPGGAIDQAIDRSTARDDRLEDCLGRPRVGQILNESHGAGKYGLLQMILDPRIYIGES